MSITHAVKVKGEPLRELDPIEEVKSSEFDNFSLSDLEDDTQFFIEEEDLNLLLSLNHYLDLNMFF